MALSRSAVDKLGERLRAGSTTEADWALLEDLRDLRREHLDKVIERIRDELAMAVTGRVKTTGTLVDKLQRERLRFSQMDDLAGARIKVDGSRVDQDDVVRRLLAIWPGARIKDRRTQPAHGYRAVHVIPALDGWPLEIQVRTHRQDAMANILESLADSWGRQIRYGGMPDAPDRTALKDDPRGTTRAELLGRVLTLAEMIHNTERFSSRMTVAATQEPSVRAVILDLESRVDSILEHTARLLDQVDE